MSILRALRVLWVLVALGAILALGACERQSGGGDSSDARSVNWKLASAFPATLPIAGEAGPYFVEKLERLSRGRIQIKFFDPGKLVPALEIFDAVSNGSVDAGWATAGYWIGKIPAAAFFTAVPFGPDSSEYLSWIYYGGGLDLWREIYGRYDVVPMPCQVTPPEASGWFREPITDLSQFEGMKIRFFGLGGQAIQKLGASVQLLAGADIFPALERGVLDATEFAIPSMDERFGFSKIAKHYYFPGWHQQVSIGELSINRDRWNGLDEIDRELIETVCKDTIVRNMTLGDFTQTAALERIKADGVQVHYWSDEFLAAFEDAWEQVIAESSAADADFKRVYESYQAFRDNYDDWARLSRVSRERE